MPDDPKTRTSRRRAPLLVALAVLLVAVLVATSLVLAQQLRGRASGGPASNTPASVGNVGTPAATVAAKPLPSDNGWTAISQAKFGDVAFSVSDPRRGYVCGTLDANNQRVFGITTDGGQTWHIGDSPATYPSCYLQISPGNPLNLTLVSVNAPGDGGSTFTEAHYSTDGGKTWKTVPLPQNTTGGGQLLWSGSYLYVVLYNLLEVSTNGGPFKQISLSSLVPGAQQVTLSGGVATAGRMYLNVQTSACQSPCELLLSSANGGASWTKISGDNPDVQLDYVQGNTLYGSVHGDTPFITTIFRSTNGGATWNPLLLQPLPISADISSYAVAPDQTIFVTVFASTLSGVGVLRDGAWTIYPFSSNNQDSIQATAISLDASGHPQKLWGHGDGAHPGLYWHNV